MKKNILQILIVFVGGLMILGAFSTLIWRDTSPGVIREMYPLNIIGEQNQEKTIIGFVKNLPKSSRKNNSISTSQPSFDVQRDLLGKVGSDKKSHAMSAGLNHSVYGGGYRLTIAKESATSGSGMGNPVSSLYAMSGKRSGGSGNNMSVWIAASAIHIGSATAPPIYKSFAASGDDEDGFEPGAGTNPGGTYNDAPVGGGTVLLLLLAIVYGGLLFLKKRALAPLSQNEDM
ncbi:MAG: hypothetical protein ACK5KP_10200 [Paludibacteraceae bacterium]